MYLWFFFFWLESPDFAKDPLARPKSMTKKPLQLRPIVFKFGHTLSIHRSTSELVNTISVHFINAEETSFPLLPAFDSSQTMQFFLLLSDFRLHGDTIVYYDRPRRPRFSQGYRGNQLQLGTIYYHNAESKVGKEELRLSPFWLTTVYLYGPDMI